MTEGGSHRSIDHVTLRVSDFAASRHFYSTVLAPLGIEPGAEHGATFAEWGDFSIACDGELIAQNVHVALAAASRAQVDAFHRAGTEAGFRDNGPPGERLSYHPGYYGAFLLDPDGNNVEAVFHDRPLDRDLELP